MKTVRFHTNPNIARAINGANKVRLDAGEHLTAKIYKGLGAFKSFLSRSYTAARLPFILYTNPARDSDFMISMLTAKEGGEVCKESSN